MDQHVPEMSSPVQTVSKVMPLQRILLSCFGLCIVIGIGISAYYFGYKNAQSHQVQHTPSLVTTKTPKKLPPTPTTASPQDVVQSIPQEALYTLSFTTPSGFRNMLWHVSAYTTEDALLSPDYTSLSDPEPQTGVVILIYEVPGAVQDMKQLRPIVEETEDGLQSLQTTTVAGYPTYYAIFQCTDANRVLYDYHILKDHDHWVVRLIFPGTSLPAAKQEAQKYNYQIQNFLQSLQFKPVQNE